VVAVTRLLYSLLALLSYPLQAQKPFVLPLSTANNTNFFNGLKHLETHLWYPLVNGSAQTYLDPFGSRVFPADPSFARISAGAHGSCAPDWRLADFGIAGFLHAFCQDFFKICQA
jgi:hypothetical protein